MPPRLTPPIRLLNSGGYRTKYTSIGGIIAHVSDRLAPARLPHDANLMIGQWVGRLMLALLVARGAIAGAGQGGELMWRRSIRRDLVGLASSVAVVLIASGSVCLIMGRACPRPRTCHAHRPRSVRGRT